MKIGTRFRRRGEAYEFLGYHGANHLRVLHLSSNSIQRILTPAAEKERDRVAASVREECQRRASAAQTKKQRIRLEAEVLAESVPALRMLRDEYDRPKTESTPTTPMEEN